METSHMSTRRDFLRIAGLAAAVAPAGAIASGATRMHDGSKRMHDGSTRANDGPALMHGGKPTDALALHPGIAGYTFLHVPVDQGIAMMKRVGVDAMSIKDFWLPLDSPADTIHGVMDKFR